MGPTFLNTNNSNNTSTTSRSYKLAASIPIVLIVVETNEKGKMKKENAALTSNVPQVSYKEFVDESKGQFGCLAKLNTGPQVIYIATES